MACSGWYDTGSLVFGTGSVLYAPPCNTIPYEVYYDILAQILASINFHNFWPESALCYWNGTYFHVVGKFIFAGGTYPLSLAPDCLYDNSTPVLGTNIVFKLLLDRIQ